MMRRQLRALILGALVVGLGGAVAAAQEAQPSAKQNAQPSSNPPRSGGAANAAMGPAPAVVADAPNARLAALIRRDLVILRNKNVAKVTRPSPGIYCILPKASAGITPSTAIVQLTPEYFYSLQNEIKVQWAAAGSGCPANTIAVYTLRDPSKTGLYVVTNGVSFSILVP
jgi:hypothetical protein